MIPAEKQRISVGKEVYRFLERNKKLLPESITNNEKDLNHVIDIAISIMCTKWKVSYPGGSFAEAIVSNNLTRTYSYADDICVQAIRFFVVMINNLDMPIDIVTFRLNEDYDRYQELTKGLH